ncbi:MAG: roadblock/LC7 domain-containing protein [Chloroflexi bacterium]|jgi:predicted regulator of Ras-like GTPase activity (Roadblock/LC7/MglB family)|nr:roadblock/LC7 domain-containing protein [Chloroflexota bacterium]
MTAKTRQEQIDDALRKLHAVVEGIKASVVVNRDGLLVAALPAGNDEDVLAAMSATLVGLAERTLGRLDQGSLERLLVEGKDSVMVAYPAGRAMLAVMVGKEHKIGPVLYAASMTAKSVAQVLAS